MLIIYRSTFPVKIDGGTDVLKRQEIYIRTCVEDDGPVSLFIGDENAGTTSSNILNAAISDIMMTVTTDVVTIN